ncbi:MAG: hypothetical protein H8E47_14155 [Anaerolineales bacterium]|nr:hypothetical protein [Anaerolineales bacterium]
MITKVRCYFTSQLVPIEDVIPIVFKEKGGRDAITVNAAPNWEPRIPLSWISVEKDAVVITV